MVLVGAGAGLSFPPLMTLAMSSADPTDAGLASGLANTTQQVGGALGLAVLATLASTHTSALLHYRRSAASALTSGYHLAWMIGTGLLIVAIATSLAVLLPAGVAAPTGKVEAQLERLTPDPTFGDAA